MSLTDNLGPEWVLADRLRGDNTFTFQIIRQEVHRNGMYIPDNTPYKYIYVHVHTLYLGVPLLLDSCSEGVVLFTRRILRGTPLQWGEQIYVT